MNESENLIDWHIKHGMKSLQDLLRDAESMERWNGMKETAELLLYHFDERSGEK